MKGVDHDDGTALCMESNRIYGKGNVENSVRSAVVIIGIIKDIPVDVWIGASYIYGFRGCLNGVKGKVSYKGDKIEKMVLRRTTGPVLAML